MSLEHNLGRRLLSAKQVMARMGWSRTTLWRRVRDGKFSIPVHTGPRSIGWYADEVDLAQKSLPRVNYASQTEAASA